MVKLKNTNIVIDGFCSEIYEDGLIYFLTHMHSDHFKGITPNWNDGPIYCS